MKSLASSVSIIALSVVPAAAEEVIDLGEIVISATVEPLEAARIGTSVEVVKPKEDPNGAGVQITDTLRQLPGIQITQTGPAGTSGDLRLRGAKERFTSVNIDGIKVNDPSSTDGIYGNFGALGAGTISRVEVLKGSQSALYGGSAVAGVVNIFTLPDEGTPLGTSQTFELSFGSYETITSAYSLVQKEDRMTLSFAIGHAQSDGFSAAEENVGNTEADSFHESRMSFGAFYKLTEAIEIGVNGFFADGEGEFDEFGAAPDDGSVGDETGTRQERGLRLSASIDAGGWKHDLAASVYSVDRRQTSATVSAANAANFASPFDSQFSAKRTRFEYVASGTLSDQWSLAAGFDYEKNEAEYANLPNGTEDITTRGAFVEAVYSPSAAVDIIGTLRYDDNSLFGDETTGRLAFSYRPIPVLTLRGAVATGYRPPSIDELFGVYPSAFGTFVGNPNLQPETSKSYEIGVDYEFVNGSQISATLFRNDIEDLIQFQFGTPSTLINVPGNSRLQGVELSYSMEFADRWDLRAAYTYLDAEDGAGAPIQRVGGHDLFVSLGVDLTDRINLRTDVQYVANRNPEFSGPLKDYVLTNATVTYDINDTSEAYFTIHNVFDREYQTAVGYGTSDRAFYAGFRTSF